MMNIYEGMKKFLQPHNYNVNNQRNQSHDRSDYTPGFYRPSEDTSHQYQNPFQPTSCLFAYQPTTDQLSSIQPLHNYQQFDHLPNKNCYENGSNFLYHSFDENYKPVSHKRAREFYDDDDFSCVPNLAKNAKKHRFASPTQSVKYAFKKASEYPQPMRKVLDTLFESEIFAEGWEKVGFNGQFQYHINIRGKNYQRVSNSVDNAREEVSVLALQELCNYEFENISWPRNLIPYRLEQSFADAIEM